MTAKTARAAGLAACHDCGGLKRLEGEHVQCPRCGRSWVVTREEFNARGNNIGFS